MSQLRMTLRQTSPTRQVKNKVITITTTKVEENQNHDSYFYESQLFGSQTQPQLWIETETEFKEQLSSHVLYSQTQCVDKSKLIQQKDLLIELQTILNGRLVKNQFDPIDDELPIAMHQQFQIRPQSGLNSEQNKELKQQNMTASLLGKEVSSMSDTELYLWIFDKTCEYLASNNSNITNTLQKLKNFFVTKILIQPSETRAYKEASEILDQKVQQLTELCDQLQTKILKSEQIIKDQQKKIGQLQSDIQDESLSKEIITRQLDVLQRDIKSKQNQYRLLQKDYEHLSLSLQDTLDKCQKLTKTTAQLKHALEKSNERYMQAEAINQKAFQNNLDLDRQNQYLLNKNDKYLSNIKQLQKQIEDLKLQMTVDKLKNTTKMQELRDSQMYLSIKTDDMGSQAQKALKLIKILAQQGKAILSQNDIDISDIQAFSHFINNIKYSTTVEKLTNAIYQDKIGNQINKEIQTDYTLLLPYNSIKQNESVASFISNNTKGTVETQDSGGNNITIIKQVMTGKGQLPEQSVITISKFQDKSIQTSILKTKSTVSQTVTNTTYSDQTFDKSENESLISNKKPLKQQQLDEELYEFVQSKILEFQNKRNKSDASILKEIENYMQSSKQRNKKQSNLLQIKPQKSKQNLSKTSLSHNSLLLSNQVSDNINQSDNVKVKQKESVPNNTLNDTNISQAQSNQNHISSLKVLPQIEQDRSDTPELLESVEEQSDDPDIQIKISIENPQQKRSEQRPNTAKSTYKSSGDSRTIQHISQILSTNKQLTIPQKIALKKVLQKPEEFLDGDLYMKNASAFNEESISSIQNDEMHVDAMPVKSRPSSAFPAYIQESLVLTDLDKNIAEIHEEINETQNFLTEKQGDLHELQRIYNERVKNNELNKEEEEILKNMQTAELDQKVLNNKMELDMEKNEEDINKFIASKVDKFFQANKESIKGAVQITKDTLFGKQVVSSVHANKLNSVDELEETIKEYKQQQAADKQWMELSHSVQIKNKFSQFLGGEMTTTLQQSQLQNMQLKTLNNTQQMLQQSNSNSISLDGNVMQVNSELTQLIRSIISIQANPYNQEVTNAEQERYVFDFDKYFDTNIIEQLYNEKAYQQSIDERMKYLFPYQENHVIIPIIIKSVQLSDINNQMLQKKTKQQFDKIQASLTNQVTIQTAQSDIEIIDGLIPNIAQSIQYMYCTVSQTYLRDFNKLLGLDLQIIKINDLQYIQFNKLFPVMRTFQWLHKTMKQIIDDRLSMSCSLLIRMPQIDDWDILVQQEMQLNEQSDRYQIISGTLNYWQAIDLSSYIAWWVQSRYGISIRSTQLILQIFASLTMYKYADYEIYLYYQLFTRQLPQDYLLLYLQAKKILQNQKYIKHEDVQAITSGLLPNMTGERRRAICLQLMSHPQITFQNLLEVVFTHYTILRQLHYGHCKQILSHLVGQHAIQASDFQQFVELSGIQLSCDQTAAYFRSYQRGGQMRTQDFLRFFIDSQAGKYAKESRHALNGILDTKVRNSINALVRTQDRFGQCLTLVQKRLVGTFQNVKKDIGNQKAQYQMQLLQKRNQSASLHNQVAIEALSDFDVYQAATSQQNAILATVSLLNATHGGVTLLFIDRMVDALRELLNIEG